MQCQGTCLHIHALAVALELALELAAPDLTKPAPTKIFPRSPSGHVTSARPSSDATILSTWVWSTKYQVIVMAIRKLLENLIVAWAHISVQGQLLRKVGRSAYHREGPEPCTAAGDSDLAASTPASFCSSGEREKKADFCDSSQRLGSTRHVRWRTGRAAEKRTYRREYMFVITKVGEKDGIEDCSCEGRTAVSGHVRCQ